MSDYLTVEELDALPVGKSVIDRFRDISTKRPDGLWDSYETAPMPSVKVAKWLPRLATPAQVAAKQQAIAAYERARSQRHTQDCMGRTRIGVPAVDACDCPVNSEEANR